MPKIHPALVSHPAVEDVDWDLLAAGVVGQNLMDMHDIAELVAVKYQPVWRWRRAADNYLLRGWREWPPTGRVLREEVWGDPDAPPLTGTPPYPWHSSVLIPPAVDDGEPRWYSGQIYQWAVIVGRLTLDGVAMQIRERRPDVLEARESA